MQVNQQHVEPGQLHVKEASAEAAAKGQGISGYETLTIWQTIKTFKVCTFVCFMVAFSGATDGYQIGCVTHRSVFILGTDNISIALMETSWQIQDLCRSLRQNKMRKEIHF
jgi:hypothetical protein